MSIEIFDEDLEQLKDDLQQKPWFVIGYEDIRNSSQLPVRISYEYLDMGKTDYGFNQQFTEKDILSYFQNMKYVSSKTIDELVDDENFSIRRHASLHKPLRDILDKVSPEIVKGQPMIFHFGLYTDKNDIASRNTGVRSPRIYFMQGLYGTIYPLFFDPYHEITR